MDLRKDIGSQDFDAEEKRQILDWLERVADGRLIVRVPAEAFGVRLGENCDRAKVRELCEKVKAKPAGVVLRPNGE